MPARKIPAAWRPVIRAIMLGSRGGISKEEMANSLGNALGTTISASRVRQIMYDYEKIDGKVQKTIPAQRKGSSDD